MVDKTPIEWAQHPVTKRGATWNPITGCSIKSPGCKNCYAMLDAWRKGFNPKTPQYHGLTEKVNGKPVWNGKVHFVEHKLKEPLRWREPRAIFVNSMSDLFHESVPDEWIDKIFAVMAMCPQHIFQVLTKRPERMREYLSGYRDPGGTFHEGIRDALIEGMAQQLHHDRTGEDSSMWLAVHLPLPNVWLGVSVEDQKRADERIPDLLHTPAAVRWVSAEPLLGPVSLEPWLEWPDDRVLPSGDEAFGCIGCDSHCPDCPQSRAVYQEDVGPRGADRCPEWVLCDRITLDWIVAGGESGPNARPMHPDWARSLRDQCAAAGTPFLFKQWGEWGDFTSWPGKGFYQDRVILPSGGVIGGGHPKFGGLVEEDWKERGAAWMVRVGKKKAGRTLDGVIHDAFPQVSP